jgi:hypothetical protein
LSCPTLACAPAICIEKLARLTKLPLQHLTLWSGTVWPVPDDIPDESSFLVAMRAFVCKETIITLAGDWGFPNLVVLFHAWDGLQGFCQVNLDHLEVCFVRMVYSPETMLADRGWTPTIPFDERVPRRFWVFVRRFGAFANTWSIDLTTVVVCARTMDFFVSNLRRCGCERG